MERIFVWVKRQGRFWTWVAFNRNGDANEGSKFKTAESAAQDATQRFRETHKVIVRVRS